MAMMGLCLASLLIDFDLSCLLDADHNREGHLFDLNILLHFVDKLLAPFSLFLEFRYPSCIGARLIQRLIILVESF